MASIMTVEGFPDVLDLRMSEIQDGEFEQVEDRISDFYTVGTPNQLTMRGSSITPMGQWGQFSGSLANLYDSPDAGYNWQLDNMEFAKGTMVERKLLEFDRFDIIDSRFSGLISTGLKFRQNQAADLFNNAFNYLPGTFNYANSEGVALCSASHTTPRSNTSTASGFSNTGTAAFSPTALKAAWITFRKFKNLAGQAIGNHQASHIILPVDLRDRADEIMQTMKGLDAAVGTVNVLENRYQVIDWIFITSTKNWFIADLPMLKKNNHWYQKVAPEFGRIEDFDTITAKYRGYMMHGVGRTPVWQYIYGSNVT